jgi:cysteine synthase B
MYKTLQDFVGNTPLVRLVRIPGADNEKRGNVILAKLEGNNPAGSVKDRPALSMIVHAEARGDIKPGDTLIEATSGNTGIALAMAAAMKGYRMILVMPENQSIERRQSMRAFGADLVLTPKDGGMELARDVADKMRDEGKGIILDQFGNPDNPLAHFEGTGPEIWRDTAGKITHFVASMGTTGTIMGDLEISQGHRIRRSRSLAVSRKTVARFPASANGRKPICPRFTIKPTLTVSNTSARPMLKQ